MIIPGTLRIVLVSGGIHLLLTQKDMAGLGRMFRCVLSAEKNMLLVFFIEKLLKPVLVHVAVVCGTKKIPISSQEDMVVDGMAAAKCVEAMSGYGILKWLNVYVQVLKNRMYLSIVSLWKKNLADRYYLLKMCITSMVYEMTTDLKTLSYGLNHNPWVFVVMKLNTVLPVPVLANHRKVS